MACVVAIPSAFIIGGHPRHLGTYDVVDDDVVYASSEAFNNHLVVPELPSIMAHLQFIPRFASPRG
jgi:hypothetical protein